MNCVEFKPMMMGYLDGELPAEQRAQFEEHVAACEACARELSEFTKLKEELTTMKFKEPSDEELKQYWDGVYNRLERGLGWVLFSVGAIVLMCYGAFKLIEEMILNPNVALALKVGVVALLFGVVILFVSLLRERLVVRKVDEYSKEVER